MPANRSSTTTAPEVLNQPTRRRLFTVLTELARSASTDELAGRLGLHPNGVRTHLARLCDAGLVVRRRVPQPRGRPRDEWAVSPTAPAGDSGPRADSQLAHWLARAIAPTRPRLREVEATGRAIGRELAGEPGPSPAVAFVDALAALGFQPATDATRSGGLSCRLRTCPYRDSVRANQEVVCTLHRGLTLGLLDVVAPTAHLERFVPHDPDRAGCEIELRRLAP